MARSSSGPTRDAKPYIVSRQVQKLSWPECDPRRSANPAIARWNACECRFGMPGSTKRPDTPENRASPCPISAIRPRAMRTPAACSQPCGVHRFSACTSHSLMAAPCIARRLMLVRAARQRDHGDNAPMQPPHVSHPRLRRLLSHEWLSPLQWRRRLLFWCGALLVALVAIAFAKLSTLAYQSFVRITAHRSWLPLLMTPAVFALLAWLTSGALRATRGSGIPQAMAALKIEDEGFRHRLLSLRIAAGKMALTLAGLLAGASIGREGPTVHVGAGLLYSLGRRFGFAEPAAAGRFVLAGAAAGLAAAFNTPLAGVVFAIEEMAGAFEHRMSGIILTAVIIAGIVSLGLLGNYAYFGTVTTALPLGQSWAAVLACGLLCGMAGGLFARIILLNGGLLSRISNLRKRFPIPFAAGCGLVLAMVGIASAGSVYGTGYDQARAIL